MKKSLYLVIILILTFTLSQAQTFTLSETESARGKMVSGGYGAGGGTTYTLSGFSYDAGTKVLTGTIKDSKGTPAVGLTIFEKGDNSNSITPNSTTGNFTLALRGAGTTVLVFDGVDTQEIDVSKKALTSLTFGGEEGEKPAIEDNFTKLTGMLVTNFGEDVVLQPNLLASRTWRTDNFGAELRLSGFQKNKDTTRYVNAVNLFKPEISNFHLRFAGEWKPKITKDNKEIMKGFAMNFELNFYNQELNNPETKEEAQDLNSLLLKLGAHYEPLDGVQFLLQAQYYNILTGAAEFEKRFGQNLGKEFLNLEASAQFMFDDGMAKGLFIQPVLLINNGDTQKLTGKEDNVVFLIRCGFGKTVTRKK